MPMTPLPVRRDRTQLFLFALLAIVALTRLAVAQQAESQAGAELPERSVGEAGAPVTVVEYFSFGCHHCANFHSRTWPEIRSKYVDTGKVRFVFRDFPIDLPSLAAAMLTRCESDRWYELTVGLFLTQDNWSHARNPGAALAEFARTNGIAREQFDACMLNTGLIEKVRQEALRARDQLGVNATPTFIVDGEKHSGFFLPEQFGEIIERALSRKPGKP